MPVKSATRIVKRPPDAPPLDPPMKYPNRLRELREGRKLTQAEAAILVGKSAAAVNRHEAGSRSLDGEMIEKYAALYGVIPYDLFVTPVENGTKS